MRNPFKRRRPFEKAVAVEVATFGRRLAELTVEARTRAMGDADLERRYAREVDRATTRIVGIRRA